MVDLKNIIKIAETANKEFHDGYPPIEKWNPENCGEIGLEIKITDWSTLEAGDDISEAKLFSVPSSLTKMFSLL